MVWNRGEDSASSGDVTLKQKEGEREGEGLACLPSFLSPAWLSHLFPLSKSNWKSLAREPGKCSWNQASATLNRAEEGAQRPRTGSYARRINLLQKSLLILQSQRKTVKWNTNPFSLLPPPQPHSTSFAESWEWLCWQLNILPGWDVLVSGTPLRRILTVGPYSLFSAIPKSKRLWKLSLKKWENLTWPEATYNLYWSLWIWIVIHTAWEALMNFEKHEW